MELTIKSTTSGKTYTIKQGKDGVLYCNCPAWKFQKKPVEQRHCKHYRMAIAELKKQSAAV